jgi:hypothetical protein
MVNKDVFGRLRVATAIGVAGDAVQKSRGI